MNWIEWNGIKLIEKIKWNERNALNLVSCDKKNDDNNNNNNNNNDDNKIIIIIIK